MKRLRLPNYALAGLMSVTFLLITILPTPAAHADSPRVIEITAKRFGFSPDQITVKKGETVILRLKTEDVTHGFFTRAFKIDEDIDPGSAKDITVTPQTAGTFPIICDHFCGAGHGNMSMTMVVE